MLATSSIATTSGETSSAFSPLAAWRVDLARDQFRSLGALAVPGQRILALVFPAQPAPGLPVPAISRGRELRRALTVARGGRPGALVTGELAHASPLPLGEAPQVAPDLGRVELATG